MGSGVFYTILLFSATCLLGTDAIVQTDPQTVLLAVNGSGFVLYPEDIGTIDIVITLSGPRLGNTKVTLTLWSSSATGGKDYIVPDTFSNITFPPSDSAATNLVVTVTVIDDEVVESIEIMQVTASFGEPEVSSNLLIIGIEDNGDKIVVDFIETVMYTNESSPLTICLVVVNGSLERSVRLELETSPITASSITDYVPRELVLIFTDVDTSVCGAIPTLADDIAENDEDFSITIKESNSVALAATGAVGFIMDMDGVAITFYDPVTSLPSSEFSITGEDPNITVCLQLISGSEPTERAVEITLFNTLDVFESSGSGSGGLSGSDVDIGFTEVSFFKLFFDVGARNGTVTCGEFEIMILGTSSFLVANLSNSLDTFLGSRTATIILTCSILEITNGNVVFSDSLLIKSIAVYQCEDGYQVTKGSEVRECQSNGIWSGEGPICTTVDCGLLLAPDNGAVQVNGTVFNSTATYSCNENLTSASTSRICQQNGVWSGEEPVCKALGCEQLVAPDNGTIQLNSTAISSMATYSCNDGFNLSMSAPRICQEDGVWSGEEPVCEAIMVCELLIDPEQGSVVITGGEEVSEAQYSCEDGHSLVGNEIRVCEEKGNWTGVAPFCIAIDSLDVEEDSSISILAISVSIGVGTLLVSVISNIFFCFYFYKCRHGKNYYFKTGRFQIDLSALRQEAYGHSGHYQVSCRSTRRGEDSLNTVGTLIENVHVVSGVQSDYSTIHSEAVQETNVDLVEITPANEPAIQQASTPESPNQDTDAAVLIPSIVPEDVNGAESAEGDVPDQQDTTTSHMCDVNDQKETADKRQQANIDHQVTCGNVVVENPQLGTLQVLQNACTMDGLGQEYSEVSVELAHHVIDVQEEEEGEKEEENAASNEIFMSFDEAVAEGDECDVHYEAYI